MPNFIIRDALPSDSSEIARLVRELAAYEKLAHEAGASEDEFRRALFGVPARAYAMVAVSCGRIVGFALYFYNFSTLVGRHGIYLEDLYVEPEQRGAGIGRAFFRALAARAVEQQCGRMEWSVLDWNEPAVKFYRALGAVAMDQWTVNRLTGEALFALAQES